MLKYELMDIELNMFDPTFNKTNKTTDTTATTGNDLSNEMKTFYSDYLIDLAEPELVHDQFGQKQPIPKNGGKTIEFRKYASLPKATTPLTEGVAPQGSKLNVSIVTATISQYGDFVEVSDILQLTAIDNNLAHAVELLGAQAGRTLDTVTREVLNGGTNVIYANGGSDRSTLVGGASSGNNYLTVRDIRLAVRALKKANAPKFDGAYWGIIHPDCEFDIMDDPDWKKPHEYVDTKNIYSNEIGMIAGVRFVESTEAKIFKQAGASSRNVYSTLIGGSNAYGVTEVTGGGLEHIYKPLGSAGSADPLNQVATAGWKATKTAERLVEEYMVRIESTSTFNDIDGN